MYKVRGIKKKTLKMILEVAKSTYPLEFSAVLRCNKRTGLIKEIMPLPGTLSSERSSTMQLHMLPIDYSVVGTVHSHPSFDCLPSDDDVFFFGKFGYIHIIVCMPFTETSWAAYDFHGNPIELEVVE